MIIYVMKLMDLIKDCDIEELDVSYTAGRDVVSI